MLPVLLLSMGCCRSAEPSPVLCSELSRLAEKRRISELSSGPGSYKWPETCSMELLVGLALYARSAYLRDSSFVFLRRDVVDSISNVA